MGAFVYILRCSDKSFYVGCATGDDLERRVTEHQSGAYHGYTSLRRPVTLVWSQHFSQVTDAISSERQIKGWSRSKKQALVDGDWVLLQQLSKRHGGKQNTNPSS